ncbi:homocysteine methyltransferase [Eremomyces bilateralis CBS 781.70]|uniref:Homocysteine methyltransferase n=1 Tax=Eremomyces bilateralis CBS 781.70 TaxID=1392243 RepID=A0A6G1GGU6_9PEZI|nr:homocysteine methyltransferase [Eremomyces bilateralis CBS 781.70]KAF1817325.1 homocysteine methyltransferase [Eremomyces bilateralis CBS 781.70]
MDRDIEAKSTCGQIPESFPELLVLDGALSTRLESTLGSAALSTPLWSAPLPTSHPDLIRSIHLEAYLAGANVVTTASYQASPIGLAKHQGLSPEESASLIAKSAELAKSAREDAQTHLTAAGIPAPVLLVAGSVGPYGAYLANGAEYRGDYELPWPEFMDFHRPRIAALLDSGVDLLALETFPNWDEATAVLGLLETEFPMARCWLSFTTRPGHPEMIADGTCWDQILPPIERNEQIIAVGVNCIPPEEVGSALKSIVPNTSKNVFVYPNSGEAWDAESRHWIENDAATLDTWGRNVREWVALGASGIGGCCRTTSNHIRTIRKVANKAERKN